MSADNFDNCYKIILKAEGGFVNNPSDPGGMTNLGVTKKAWEAYVGHQVNEADMRALTPATVKPFYKKLYWDKVCGDALPKGVDLCVFDFQINAGSHSAKQLQSLIGVTADGNIGPATLLKLQTYVQAHGVNAVIEGLAALRKEYYQSLPTFPTFGRGWIARTDVVKVLAESMH